MELMERILLEMQMPLLSNQQGFLHRKIVERGCGMDVDAAVKLEGHEHEIGSLKHRVKDLEEEGKVIQGLAISINKMAVNMENMLLEQKRQGDRLEVLEKVPLETNKQVKAAIITALVGGIVGAILTAVLTLL